MPVSDLESHRAFLLYTPLSIEASILKVARNEIETNERNDMKTNLKSEVRGSKGEVRGARNAGGRVGTQFGGRRKVGALVDKNARVTTVPSAAGNLQPEFAIFASESQHSTTPPLQDSIQNTDGFWELGFGGQRAVLPQHQGLFFVAWLLANPHAAPIPAADLAVEVFERFGEHEDFRPPIPEYLRNHSRVAKILLRKEKRLEAVVDREGEEDFVRLEALRELIVLDELKRLYFAQVASEAKDAGKVVSEALRELHLMLASAVDVRGKPQRVIRDFATHLWHYVLMPSERVSVREGVALFVYRPAVEGN
jgi:hypothetical protein